LLQAMPSTEVYLAHIGASLPALRYGSEDQVRAKLGYLHPRSRPDAISSCGRFLALTLH
jgi:hypothetical protein